MSQFKPCQLKSCSLWTYFCHKWRVSVIEFLWQHYSSQVLDSEGWRQACRQNRTQVRNKRQGLLWTLLAPLWFISCSALAMVTASCSPKSVRGTGKDGLARRFAKPLRTEQGPMSVSNPGHTKLPNVYYWA